MAYIFHPPLSLHCHRTHCAPGRWIGQVWPAFFDHLADKLAEVEGYGLHLELVIGAFVTIRMSAAGTVDIGQAENDAFNIHTLLDALFESVGLVEGLSGFDLGAVEADKNLPMGRLFAVRAATLIPERAVLAEFGREAEVKPAFAAGFKTAGGRFVVRTGEGVAIVGQGEITRVET